MIAVGTMSGWIRVHDHRTGNSSEMNILAHADPKNKRVKGIKFDPFNGNILASFSDISNEPIKVY